MPAPRRSRVAAYAAALSATLAVGMAGTALATEDLDCSDFEYQEAAQAALDADRSDPHGLDGTANGVACDALPSRDGQDDAEQEAEEDVPATTPAVAPDGDTEDDDTEDDDTEDDDRDCADFATQAEAQAALVSGPGDRERLDTDDDGIACEQHFGTEGRQVAVFPQGGVATGGSPRP